MTRSVRYFARQLPVGSHPRILLSLPLLLFAFMYTQGFRRVEIRKFRRLIAEFDAAERSSEAKGAKDAAGGKGNSIFVSPAQVGSYEPPVVQVDSSEGSGGEVSDGGGGTGDRSSDGGGGGNGQGTDDA